MTFARRSLIAGLALGVVLVVSPTSTRAQTFDAAFDTEEREVEVTWPNTPLVVSGLFTFGLSYGISAFVAAITDSAANDQLYVPVIGPWLDIYEREHCPLDEADCAQETTNKIRLGVLGAFQAIGAATFVYGLITQRKVNRATVAGKPIDIVPVMMDGGGKGFGVTGSF